MIHDRRGSWQFTLREAMIGVAVLCTVLGFGAWKGLSAAIAAFLVSGLFLLGLAVYLCRKRLAICTALCLLVVVIPVGLFSYGPRSDVQWLCRICGKRKTMSTFLGATWHESERETDLSEWYRRAGLKPHTHQWVYLCSYEQHWGGGGVCGDAFGFELIPLDLLREASEKVDRSTFEDLANDYEAMRQDPARTAAFVRRVEKIVARNQPVPIDP